jgi:hypothetical protein
VSTEQSESDNSQIRLFDLVCIALHACYARCLFFIHAPSSLSIYLRQSVFSVLIHLVRHWLVSQLLHGAFFSLLLPFIPLYLVLCSVFGHVLVV